MNLKENKIITLGLIEEFSPNSEFLTDDTDIKEKINGVYNACLMNIARNKRIEKTFVFEDKEDSQSDYYQEFDLPSDCYIIRDIIVQDTQTNGIRNMQGDYYRLGKQIYINTKIKGNHILRYYAYPKEIKSDEIDEKYRFDIDRDIQYLLPYAVASDILKMDRSSDYTAFENKYRTELSSLSVNKEEMQVYISSDIDI